MLSPHSSTPKWAWTSIRSTSLRRNKRWWIAASYIVPLLVSSLGVLCLVGVLRVYDPVSTKNLKHQSNLSTFMGLFSGPRPFTHLGSLVQQLRIGLQEPRGDIATYKHQLRTEIYYLKKELALLERDLRVPAISFDQTETPSEFLNESISADDNGKRHSWLDREYFAVDPESQEVSIPFYMYDFAEVRTFHRLCNFSTEGVIEKGGHKGEYFFHQQLLNHRWRILDPEKAIFFVVPVYLGAAFEGNCGGDESGQQMILDVTKALTGQPWFQRYSGNDHLFVGTHWRIFWWFRDAAVDKSVEVWNKLIWGRYMSAFEESFCPLVLPYSTLPIFDERFVEELEHAKQQTVEEYMTERPYTFFFMGRVFFEHHRGGYATRRVMFDNVKDYRGPNVIITTLAPPEQGIPSCSGDNLTRCLMAHSDEKYARFALQSKYHFIIRGDDWTTSRLFDAIHSGGLPVLVSDGLLDKGLPFGCHVDWANLVIRIPEKDFRNNATLAIEKYVPDWETAEGRADLQRRLRILHDIRDDVSWSSTTSRVAENFLLDAARRCLPEAMLIRRSREPETKSLSSLTELTCPFTDYAKGLYRPGRHGMGALQEGWNQDD
eukprot:Blabericola_migrator_1__3338@NODE_1985_length_3456_cov_99_251107_g1263_i0_p1_GENE_NODE_1985_length_3456_cov_99_251107_g1263_i0NODE_1985_length_3456_cov_99_251107_g1263_i0_p1_ORF_typecomplete_len602_score76_96Exostosin/PF03016_15/7e35Glyco_transf_49/PF13896_6/0_08_NODE_1985_length_3456_cov_99_251107_g1263_i03782183